MHIEAELDPVHAQRFLELQQRFNKSPAEIIADLIDTNWRQNIETKLNDETSLIYQAFDTAGLIGCISTGEQLSTSYKEKMDFSNKIS
ncbi:hypothetical protein KEF85_04765 [Methylomonas paludis]|uniref:Uncharacterized protein n=1 Tax=Methylomonas paludis TaxID=1173101 RepID=A0A975MQ96_9GAMM|nr:hypothetical protein [Methylomonas paludis]QWF71789.1 hypothetical protein KEF85_04765 [Methylomonas paludis]